MSGPGKTRIVIVLEGGLVSDVYCDCDADVEIIDLDRPSFPTREEQDVHAETVNRHGEVVADQSLRCMY